MAGLARFRRITRTPTQKKRRPNPKPKSDDHRRHFPERFLATEVVSRAEFSLRRDAPQPLSRVRPAAEHLARASRPAVRPLDALRLRRRQARPQRSRRLQL